MKRFLFVINIILFLFCWVSSSKAQNSQTVNSGSLTTAITFPGPGCGYKWVNNTPGIGLAASGNGDIAAFTAINNGTIPVTATIKAAPLGFSYIAANAVPGKVYVFDNASNNLITTIATGDHPDAVAASADGKFVYVATDLGEIAVISTTTNTVAATITGINFPGGIAVSPDGSKLYVTNNAIGATSNASVTVISTATNLVLATIGLPFGDRPVGVAVSPDGSKIYIADNGLSTVSVIDAASSAITVIPIDAGTAAPHGVTVSPDGSRVYVTNDLTNDLSIIDASTNTVVNTIAVGFQPFGVAVSPDGSRVYTANSADPSISVIDANNNTKITDITTGLGSYIVGVSLSPDGSLLYATSANSDNVSVISTASNLVVATIPLPPGSNAYSFGNFVSTGPTCPALTYTITVNPLLPFITAGAVSGNISACQGTPSASPYLQQFSVSGGNLTADITATAPAGFEASLSPGSGYTNSLTIPQTGGTVNSTLVYVRSAASATGNISGMVSLTSGAISQNVPVAGTINALPTVNAVADQTVANGSSTTTINFTGTANAFNWTNDTPSIGFPPSGTGGQISSFTAINTGASTVVATFNVTPVAGPLAYIANETDGTLSVINTVTDDELTTIPVSATPLSAHPIGVAVSPDGNRVYVVNNGLNTVSVINTVTSAIAATISVGQFPVGAAISPDGSRLYVANENSNNISVINTASNTLITNVNADISPYGIAVSPDGSRVYVTNFGSNSLSIIDATNNTLITNITVGLFPVGVTVSPDGSRVYVTNQNSNNVSVINAATNALVTNITVGTHPVGIAVSPDGSRLYVSNAGSNSVSVIDATNNSLITGITVDSVPYGITVSPDGTQVFVANQGSGTVSVISTYSNTVTTSVDIGNSPYSLGNFIAKSVSCAGVPITFTIKVTSTLPVITATGILPALTTTYGTPSASASITVSGVNIAGGILVTPPAGFEVSTDNVNFSSTVTVTGTGTVAPTPVYIRLSAIDNVGNYSGDLVLTSTGATDVHLPTTNSTVTPAPLTVTANNVNKPYGTVITGGTGSTAFTVMGLKNSETIGSVTIAYGAGSAATDASQTYTGSVIASAATGGTFTAGNYSITYVPGNIVVNAAAGPPSITTTQTSGSIAACAGSASVSPNLQQFTFSGSNLTADVAVTAPAGFEVSLTSGSGYAGSIIVAQSGGIVNSTVVYVRSSATAPSGNLIAKVSLTSPGANGPNVAVSATINALPTVNTIANQVVIAGNATTAVNFTGTGNTFTWTNDTPGIGLAASGSGDIASFTAVNTGTAPITATITATPIAAGLVYIANALSNNVSVISTATNRVIKTIPVGANPWAVSVSPNASLVYTANEGSNDVSVISVLSNTVIATIDLGKAPRDLVISPDGSRLYVTTVSNTVSVISTATNTVIATINTGNAPFGIAVSPDGSLLYVANNQANSVSVINAATGVTLASVPVGINPLNIITTADGKFIYVTNEQEKYVSVIDGGSNTVVSKITLGTGFDALAISRDGKLLYVSSYFNMVAVINTATNAVVTTIPVGSGGSGPEGISITRDGSLVYTSTRSNYVAVINAATNAVISTIPVGNYPVSFGNFIADGSGCTGTPTTFTITVNPSVPALITATPATGAITACAGAASSNPNIQQFTVSGSNLTAGITATAPTGFEVSLTAAGGYGSGVTINQASGSVNNSTVYVRSAASATAGNLSGNVTLSSTGAANQTVAVTGIVNALPTVNTIANQVIVAGNATTVVNFTGTGNTFTWTNDTPGIGLAASGSGDIASFTAVNTGANPVIATVTVTPLPVSYAYIANGNSNTVSVINTKTNASVATVAAGVYPTSVSVTPDGSRVYVANYNSDNVTVINTGTNTVLTTIAVSAGPQFVLVSADGKWVYTAGFLSGAVSVISTATNQVTATIPVGLKPWGLALSPDGGTLYVSDSQQNTVYIVNTASGTVTGNFVVGVDPEGIALSPDGSRLYVANRADGTISVINTGTKTVVATVQAGDLPTAVSVSPDGSRVYVANVSSNDVSVINTANNTVVATISVGSAPDGISISADGTRIFVEIGGEKSISVIDAATNTILNALSTSAASTTYGNFLSTGTGCTGAAITFTITVNPAAAQPASLLASPATGNITTCAGTTSASPKVQQFSVEGAGLTADVIATAPADFEVSLSATSGFSASVTLAPLGGAINDVKVYVRSAASAAVGNISGKVILSTTGVPDQTVPVSGVVNALPTVNTVANQTIITGTQTNPVNFSGTANSFAWTNDTPAIGLASGGTGNIAAFTAVNTGTSPVKATVTVTPSSVGYAYIANSTSGNVSVINTQTNAVVNTITVGQTPTGVAVSPDGTLVYVANQSSGGVSVISTKLNALLTTILTTGNSPTALTVSPDGTRLYVVNLNSNDLSVINTGTYSLITTIPVGGYPNGVAVSPDGSRVYVANSTNSITVIDATQNTVKTTIPVGKGPYGLTVSPDGLTLYVAISGANNVAVINTATNTVTTTIPVGLNPLGVAMSPDGSLLYVSNQFSKTISVISTATNAITTSIAVGANPSGISVSADGSLLYVANYNDNTVSAINTTTNTVVSTIVVGSNPLSLGNFMAGGNGCSGTPTTFTITVNPNKAIITAAGTPSALTTVYGTPSSSTSFTVSGTDLTAGISIVPPTGFELSTDNITFAGPVTVSAPGTVTDVPVYIRLAATTPVGTYSGNITLSSQGAVDVTLAMPNSTVTPAPLTITANNVNKNYGTAIASSAGSPAFTSTGLKNSESIGSITLAYGAGAAAKDGAGTYKGSVTASAAIGGSFTPGNYTITYLPGDLIVVPLPLTIIADDKTKIYGDPNPILTVAYIGFINSDGPATLLTQPVITTTAVTTSPVGQYPITASGATAANYTITYLPGTLTIELTPQDLVIPNTFTPNGDGINDTWNIKNLEFFPNCNVEIFTRYGQKVFSSIGYGISWDGTYNNARLPTGTYYYIIDLKNKGKALSGFVAIVR